MRTGKARSRGFTLIELIVVVAIIGILVTVGMPIYRDSVRKAREAVLQEDLYILRDSIDQYFTDKGYYPADLGSLVEANYVRMIPVDPITGSADTWIVEDAPADESNPDQPSGIYNVRSGADGLTINGVPYGDL